MLFGDRVRQTRLRLVIGWKAQVIAWSALALVGYFVVTHALDAPTWVRLAAFAVAFPGIVSAMMLSGSYHGGGFGDARDPVIISIVSGVVWGTLVHALLRRWRSRPATIRRSPPFHLPPNER